MFLVQGDDDRNVDFAQTVGLVQLLRAHNVYYELTVIPDDMHESLLHAAGWTPSTGWAISSTGSSGTVAPARRRHRAERDKAGRGRRDAAI